MMRKEYVIGAIFVLLLTMSLASYLKSEGYEKTTLIEQVIQRGELKHSAYLANDTVYGRIASLEYYPTRILEAIYGNYTYSIEPSESGSYYILGTASYYVTKGQDKIYLVNETLFSTKGKLLNGTFSQSFSVNLTKIKERRKELAEALQLPRIQYEVKVTAKVRTREGEFSQEMPIVEDTSGLTYIKNTELEKKRNIVETSTVNNKLLGMNVSTARVVFPILTLISGIALLALWKPRPKRKINAIEGIPKGISSRVLVNDEKSLKKIAKIIGSPIIHYTLDGIDVYGVIDGSVIYEWWGLKSAEPESKQ
ncbi:DUF5305 family protein [Pyrococcus kukulkanii]|uniref:DUF5305 domain-containing protein n=1 Tax=Pyrococcus kukulkanii TaxID=1609559 RepID=A0A127B7Y9_9EURY|nr:DUF5305 family protein [Pyrococcus kukulkanii]AMM53384.1 hypothetical protein TQ32_01910 [Pyrococcus kukulkanii]